MWPFDQIKQYLKRQQALKEEEVRQYQQIVRIIENFRGFTREVWIDNSDRLQGRYLALPGHKFTQGMISLAKDDFLNALAFMDFTNLSNYASDPDAQELFDKHTVTLTDEKNKVIGIRFTGGYSNYNHRKICISFDEKKAERYSVRDWHNRMQRSQPQ